MKFYTEAFVESVVLASPVHCGSVSPFYRLFKSALGEKTTLDEVLTFTAKYLIDYRKPNHYTQQNTLTYLMYLDLNEIFTTIKYIKKEKLDDIESSLKTLYRKFVPKIKRWGFDFEMPVYEIVDKFGGVYTQSDFWAMNYDEEDALTQGLKPGIYFKRDKLCPLGSQLLLAHEFFHQLPAHYDPKTVPQILEEGLAELIGRFYFGTFYFDRELLKTFLINRSFKSFIDDTVWERYFSGLVLASFFYQKFGLKGIVYMIKKGRRYLVKVEEKLMEENFEDIELPQGQFDKNLDWFTNIVLSRPRFIRFKPVAYYIYSNIRAHESINDLRKKLYIKEEDFAKGLAELRQAHFVLVVNGIVKYEDTKRFLPVVKYIEN